MKNTKALKRKLVFVSIALLLGGSESQVFASSSSTANYQITTLSPTLGISITAPNPVSSGNIQFDTSTNSYPEYTYEPLQWENTGNEPESLQLNVGSASVTGTINHNVLTLSGGQNLGESTNGSIYSGTTPSNNVHSPSTLLGANSFDVFMVNSSGTTSDTILYNMENGGLYEIGTTPTNFGVDGTDMSLFHNEPVEPTQTQTDNLLFALGAGTSSDTYEIPINATVTIGKFPMTVSSFTEAPNGVYTIKGNSLPQLTDPTGGYGGFTDYQNFALTSDGGTVVGLNIYPKQTIGINVVTDTSSEIQFTIPNANFYGSPLTLYLAPANQTIVNTSGATMEPGTYTFENTFSNYQTS